MRLPPPLHRWNLSVRSAIALQRRLAAQVETVPGPDQLRWVAGVDAAFSADGRWCVAGVVLWDLVERRAVEARWARAALRFPYIPGLLSFREMPGLLAALGKLAQPPDLVMCDGQGIAHPRRFGIASHLGLWLGRPALGCAKSRLIGTHGVPGMRRGCRTELVDRGQILGAVLRTRDGVKPVYVSPGHRTDTESACRLVLECSIRYRLPEPTRLADRLVAQVKRALKAPASP